MPPFSNVALYILKQKQTLKILLSLVTETGVQLSIGSLTDESSRLLTVEAKNMKQYQNHEQQM